MNLIWERAYPPHFAGDVGTNMFYSTLVGRQAGKQASRQAGRQATISIATEEEEDHRGRERIRSMF